MKILSLIISFLFMSWASAQEINFIRYTSADGLGSELCKSVTSDTTGFIYTATDDGLFLFDGKIFTKILYPEAGIQAKHVFRTSKGKVLISTDMGLYFLSQAVPKVQLKLIAGGNVMAVENELWYPKLIFEDQKKRVWITDNHQIFRLDDNNTLHSASDQPEIDSDNVTRSFILTDDGLGNLWAFYGHGKVFLYNEKTGRFQAFPNTFDFQVHHALCTNAGTLLLSTNEGLIELNTHNKQKLTIRRTLSKLEFSWIQALENGNYVGGTWKDGLFQINIDESEAVFTKIGFDDLINVNHIFKDRRNNIWVSTDNGLVLIRYQIFRNIISKTDKQYIHDIVQHHDGSIFYSGGKNIVRISLLSGKETSEEVYKASANQEILRLAFRKNSLLFSDNLGHIYSLDLNTNISKSIYFESEKPIFILEEDKNGNIWFCQDQTTGVLKMDSYNEVKQYLPIRNQNSRIITVKPDKKTGNIYLGGNTDQNYLIRYEPASDSFYNLSQVVKFQHNVDINVNDICIASTDSIWLATSFGLVLYNKKEFKRIDLEENTSNTIKGIDLNKDGSLWLSLSTGMLRYKSGVITSFSEQDGLPIKTMTYRSVLCDSKGNVWTGSIAGLSTAENMPEPALTPIALLWKFEINGKETISNEKSIYINKKSFARFTFNTPSYPGFSLRYQYKIYSSTDTARWIDMNNPLEIFPDGLKNGNYTLEIRVKKAGNYLWSQKLAFNLIIKNIWYESFWFWGILISFIVGITYLIFYYRIRLSRISEIKLHKEIVDRTKEIQLQKIHILEQKSAIERKNEILEVTNAELTIQKQKAENLALMKSQFLSNMSHELRTPMNAVIGMTYILLQEEPNPAQTENLNTLRFSAENLLALINDILDFSKIDAGKISFEEADFDVRDKIHSVLQVMKVRANEKNIEFQTDIDPKLPDFVVGDPLRFNQVLFNIIGNAVKFTEKGKVGISVKLLNFTDFDILLEGKITDTGIGIDAKRIDAIFDTFAQADLGITRKYGGTGLGLSITKKLIELQGGSIEVESTEGRGSTFRFVIPYKRSEKKHSNQNDTYSQSYVTFNKEKVLLVDDNQVNLIVARKFLMKWNLDVDTAENGIEAVEKAIKNRYQLIFMDIQMPEMDGSAATRKIREFETTNGTIRTPIIALTASALIEVKTRLIKEGMDDFVTKPFNPSELNYKVSLYLNKTEEKN